MKANQLIGKQLFELNAIYRHEDYIVHIAIDFDYPGIREKIKEMSMFWAGHPAADAPFSDHLLFVLQEIAGCTYSMWTRNTRNHWGIAMSFKDEDGYLIPLDGSKGILLKYTYFPEVDADDFWPVGHKPFKGDFSIERPQ